MIKTELCDVLGIEHPIIQGGMAWVATAELVSAVSEAGGLGVIGSGNAPGEWVRVQIREVRSATDKPFGVNIMLMSPFAQEVINVCLEEKVPVVTTGAGSPGSFVESFKKAGVKVVPVVASVALAKRMQRYGADAIIAEGMESGGHVGEMTTITLVPMVVDVVSVPVVAGGGIADGRGLVAALALGAAGVQMGTRFICSDECIAHPDVKKTIVEASDRATAVAGATIGHPVRALKNRFVREFLDLERQGAVQDELEAFGAGRMKLGLIDGDVKHGSLMAGQVAGMVCDIKPVRQIIDDIVAEATEVMDRICLLRSAGKS
jgi:enoyl-[acyl-carrier protein] reductase II